MSRRKIYSGRKRQKPLRCQELGYSRKSKISMAGTPWAKGKRETSFQDRSPELDCSPTTVQHWARTGLVPSLYRAEPAYRGVQGNVCS